MGGGEGNGRREPPTAQYNSVSGTYSAKQWSRQPCICAVLQPPSRDMCAPSRWSRGSSVYSHTDEHCGWSETVIVATQFVLHKREKDFTGGRGGGGGRKGANRVGGRPFGCAISKVERTRERQFE